MSLFLTLLLDSFWILILNEIAASPFVQQRGERESREIRNGKFILGGGIFTLALASALSIPKLYIAPVITVAIFGWLIHSGIKLARRVSFYWYLTMLTVTGIIASTYRDFYDSNRPLVYLGLAVGSLLFYWIISGRRAE